MDQVLLTLTVVERVQENRDSLGSPRMLGGIALLVLALLAFGYSPVVATVVGVFGLLLVVTAARSRSSVHDLERDLTFRIDRGGVWLGEMPCTVRVDRTSIGFDGSLYPLARPLTGEELLQVTELLDRDMSGEVPEGIRSLVVDR